MREFERELDSLCEIIARRSAEKHPLFVAVDGGCASGKTTLAERLSGIFDCAVIHADDFFLRPDQRTEERKREIGGNIDYERFYEEVSLPLSRGEVAKYRRFDCKSSVLSDYTEIPKRDIYIIEGCYSLHPKLDFLYDVRVLMTVDDATRDKRLSIRSPEKLDIFKSTWIPLEQAYFEAVFPNRVFDTVLHSGVESATACDLKQNRFCY